MYIKDVYIENIRCFRQASLDLNYPGKSRSSEKSEKAPDSDSKERSPGGIDNINLLLGDNGVGKTTILRALALGALSPFLFQSDYRPYRFVRREPGEEKQARGRITLTPIFHKGDLLPGDRKKLGSEQLGLDLAVGDDGVRDTISSGDFRRLSWWSRERDLLFPFLVAGYGTSRFVRGTDPVRRGEPYRELFYNQQVVGLFEDKIGLIALSSWLPELREENARKHKEVVELINNLLPQGADFAAKVNNQNEYVFNIEGVDVPFDALSDGYRAYISWIADLTYRMVYGTVRKTKLADTRGVVLVDEIDLHLHPAWQRSVILSISENLPNLQFVFTTHSPLVAGSFENKNVFLLADDGSEASKIRLPDDNIHGLDADQLLTGPLFGLRTSRSETFVAELRDLSLSAARGNPEAAFEFLQRLTGVSKPAERKTPSEETGKDPSSGMQILGFSPLRVRYSKFRKYSPFLGTMNIVLLVLLGLFVFLTPNILDLLLSSPIMTAGLIVFSFLLFVQLLLPVLQRYWELRISRYEAKLRKKI